MGIDEKTKKIIVIDDDSDILEYIKQHIERLKFLSEIPSIDLVAHSKNIETYISDKKYDIIITDYKMPDIDGFELTKIIRNGNSPNKMTPIIFISGYISNLEAADAPSPLHNVYFLNKPLVFARFEKLMKMLLSTRISD